MFSVGIDTAECRRIEKAMKTPRFFQRVFAKEAFGKAMGTGVRGFRLNEVQLLRLESGAPCLVLSGEAAKLAEGWRFAVSATHTNEYASVVVLAEKSGV